MLQLLKACIRAKIEDCWSHVNALKQAQQLLRAGSQIPPASEAGKKGVDFVEVDAVAPIVPIPLTDAQIAAFKRIGDDLCDLTDLVVLRGRTDVENLVVDNLPRSIEHAGSTCERAPGAAQGKGPGGLSSVPNLKG